MRRTFSLNKTARRLSLMIIVLCFGMLMGGAIKTQAASNSYYLATTTHGKIGKKMSFKITKNRIYFNGKFGKATNLYKAYKRFNQNKKTYVKRSYVIDKKCICDYEYYYRHDLMFKRVKYSNFAKKHTKITTSNCFDVKIKNGKVVMIRWFPTDFEL